jgi:N-acetylated-alpha-linked acidic dipeptidase
MAARQIQSTITTAITTRIIERPHLRIHDPRFRVHTAIGQFLSLILSHIADDALILWDLLNAATVLQAYYAELNETITESDFPGFNISAVGTTLEEFTKNADHIAEVAYYAMIFNDSVLLLVVNSKYCDFAGGFASAGGLPNRETIKNVISAPGIDNGYGAGVFQAVTDSINHQCRKRGGCGAMDGQDR